jgi:hypothetical protein
MQKRYAVRAALGGCVLVALAACVTKGEFTALQNDFKRLEERVRAASDGPSDASLQLQRQHVREDESALQTKYNSQTASLDAGTLSKVGQDKFNNALKVVQQKLRKDGGQLPDLGEVTFNCRETICQGTSKHPSAESYKAFVLTAFGGGPNQYHAWYSFTRVEGADATLERNTIFYTGIPTPEDLAWKSPNRSPEEVDGTKVPKRTLETLDGGKGPKRTPEAVDGGKGPKR